MTQPVAAPTHVPMDQFPVVGNELQVGGIPLSRLAARVGQTPFYVDDRRLIDARITALRSVLPAAFKLHYAVKANPMAAVVGHIAAQVDGLDTASGAEMTLALNAGMAPRHVSFAGPGKQTHELEQAVAAGILINVESLREAERLAEISARTGWAARVALRINPAFDTCTGLDFHARNGEQELADKVATMLDGIRAKYKEYGVSDEPFVVVKADAGTYGMGVMTVKDAAELIGLNRKQRNKMSVVKEGLEVHDVIIQEGVHTFETLNGAVAEPVVYMMDHYVVGGFYRVHTQRGRDENLNAPGMHFEPLAFEAPCSLPDCNQEPDAAPNRFYAYGVVARLALLAASVEIEETAPAVAVEA